MSAVPRAAGGEVFARLIADIAERGDRQAFAALFSHFAPRVKSYLLRLGTGAEAAEELAQECLLIVWRRAATFDPARAAASTWIFTIARNLRIDLARKERRPAAGPDYAEAEMAPPTPFADLAASDDVDQVGAALGLLPGAQAQVVRMAFYLGKPHAQIAEELKLPLGTVKSRLRLAMARLRVLLEGAR